MTTLTQTQTIGFMLHRARLSVEEILRLYGALLPGAERRRLLEMIPVLAALDHHYVGIIQAAATVGTPAADTGNPTSTSTPAARRPPAGQQQLFQ